MGTCKVSTAFQSAPTHWSRCVGALDPPRQASTWAGGLTAKAQTKVDIKQGRGASATSAALRQRQERRPILRRAGLTLCLSSDAMRHPPSPTLARPPHLRASVRSAGR